MAYQTTDAETAFARTLGDDSAHWGRQLARFASDSAVFPIRPKFTLEGSRKVFCIGSCFARNIEELLIYRGFDVLSKRAVCPKTEWASRPNGFLNKFTTHSMVQELEWMLAPRDFRDTFCEDKGGWMDLQLSPGMLPSSFERCVERRDYIVHQYFPRIRQADLVVVTLGLNEVWRDDQTGLWLNAPPSFYTVRKAPRYSFHVTDVAENVQQLERLRDIVKSVNQAARILVTVSPVPLATTFSGADVAAANTLSKATLRCAAEMVCRAHDDVDYFPSFEMASLPDRSKVYAEDGIHVREDVVKDIISLAVEAYFGLSHEPWPHFKEMRYLNNNPDIDARVRSGELESGFEHWIREGRAKGRPLGLPPM